MLRSALVQVPFGGFEFHVDARARSGRGLVTTIDDLSGMHEVFVLVVHIFDDAIIPLSTDRQVIEHGEVTHHLAQADTAGVGGHTRTPNLLASRYSSTISCGPATRVASICMTLKLPACRYCLYMMRFCICSPVAAAIGSMAR